MDQAGRPPPTPDFDASRLAPTIWFAAAVCSSVVIVVAIYCSFWRRNRHARNRHESSGTSPVGLDGATLDSIPVFVYSCGDEEAGPLECSVCLAEFRENEKGRVLPDCRHTFHVDCVDKWFRLNSTCPLCRSVVEAGSTDTKKQGPGNA